MATSSEPQETPPVPKERVAVVCEEFLREWQSGRRISAEEFVAQVPEPERSGLLRELKQREATLRADTLWLFTPPESASLSETSDFSPSATACERKPEPARPVGRISPHAYFLGTCGPFATLRPATVQMLAELMREASFAPGEALIRQGDPGQNLIVLIEGVVSVRVRGADGQERVIDTSTRGAVLGEMALLTREPCTASVIANTPVQALLLPAADFHHMAEHNPALGEILTRLIASRVGDKVFDALGGKTLDRYRVLRRLGRGGMGVVYQAETLDDKKPVALKMLSHRLVYDAEALARFQYEADIIEKLDSPYVVRTFGRFPAFSTYFIAMELCDGVTLSRIIKNCSPIPTDEIRAILGQLARALDHAHRMGVVHRDIKPGNVMLDTAGCVKLMDFGLAKPIEEPDPTQRHCIVGTLGYMAPEQMDGQIADAVSDLYSFGCVALEMLTGRRLFVGRGLAELLEQQSNWSLPKPKQIRQNLEPDLYQMLERSLATDPEKRTLRLPELFGWARPVSTDLVRKALEHTL